MSTACPGPNVLGVVPYLAPYTSSMWGISKSEQRRRGAEYAYALKMEFRKMGWSSNEQFIYDEEHDLFRFPDGEFAFSEEYVNERR